MADKHDMRREVKAMAKRKQETVWRIWVDTERRIVSFHEEPGSQMLEFRSYELFQTCIDQYTAQRFRYQ